MECDWATVKMATDLLLEANFNFESQAVRKHHVINTVCLKLTWHFFNELSKGSSTISKLVNSCVS